MKRLAILLVVALSLGGCAGLMERFIGFDVTASIDNPVTPDRLNKIEQAGRIATAGLLTYRRLCILKKIDRSCRGVITDIQFYTRQLCTTYAEGRCQTGVLADVRTFVRTNDQVNAIKAFNLARDLMNTIQIKRTAAKVDAAIGGRS